MFGAPRSVTSQRYCPDPTWVLNSVRSWSSVEPHQRIPTVEKDHTGIGQQLCADVHTFLFATGYQKDRRVLTLPNAQLIDYVVHLSQFIGSRQVIGQSQKRRVGQLLLNRQTFEEDILLEHVG